jgi:hypothetical protein
VEKRVLLACSQFLIIPEEILCRIFECEHTFLVHANIIDFITSESRILLSAFLCATAAGASKCVDEIERNHD